MTDQITPVQPSATLQEIHANLSGPAEIIEVDAHIGRLHREIARYTEAYRAIFDHAVSVEQHLQAAISGQTGRDALINHLKSTVSSLEDRVGNLTTELQGVASEKVLHLHPGGSIEPKAETENPPSPES